jgi:hypothetical protein
MLKWLDRVGRVVILAFGIIIVYRFWVWWLPEEPETYLRTDLVNAQESDTFITGFAMVSLVQFDIGEPQLKPFSYISSGNNRSKIEGFCYRLFELAIGYDSLWATIKNAEASRGSDIEIPPPRVLAADVVEARQGGDDTSQRKCDRINLVAQGISNDDRRARLQQALEDNSQWDSHVRHARNVVTTFSATIAERRQQVLENRLDGLEEASERLDSATTAGEYNDWLDETREDLAETAMDEREGERGAFRRTTGIEALDQATRLEEPEVRDARGDEVSGPVREVRETLAGALDDEASRTRLALADAGGFLGTLKLTFSTIGIFTQEKRRWVFWKNGQFYIRQDFADATYGSDFTLDIARSRGGLFGPRRLEVTVPEPYLLALDRYTTVIASDPRSFRLKLEDDTGETIEESMKEDLQRQIDRVEPQAIRFAKAMLTSQIQQLVQAEVSEVSVRFSGRDVATPRQLSELIRLMRERGEDET